MSLTDITNMLAIIRQEQGPRVVAPLSAQERDRLEALASFAGCTTPVATAASDADLVALYSVASKRPSSAQAIADNLNRRYGTRQAPATPTPVMGSLSRSEIVKIVEEYAGKSYSRAEILELLDVEGEQLRKSIDRDFTERVNEYVDNRVTHHLQSFRASEPVNLIVTSPASADPVNIGLAHYKTADIIKLISAGLNVYVHGPAGSGKTTMAKQVATALGLDFYFAAKVESEYLLLGFKDARGEVVRTQFRDAYENGGLFLFDELDGSAPGAIVAINAALANGICAFPDGTIARHKDFHCIAAGNTVLTGANVMYNGRSALDAASVDRFAFVEFPYDEGLERTLADNQGWCLHVQTVRKAVAERGIQHLVTPRATYDGCKSLAAGFSWQEAEMMHIFKGLDADIVAQLRNASSILSVRAA